MKKPLQRMQPVLLAMSLLPCLAAADLADITNFREYSDSFASAGQPTAAQLSEIRDAGYERIIYIAFSTDRNALAEEDRIVKELGMDYVHIPVVWNEPTAADFAAFASVMRQAPESRTLLHCQVNFRASAFSFLYRVIHEGVPMAQAKADMDSVWRPNETWRDFIFDVLAENGMTPDCPGCDWAVPE